LPKVTDTKRDALRRMGDNFCHPCVILGVICNAKRALFVYKYNNNQILNIYN
jgi:hypothetical protein